MEVSFNNSDRKQSGLKNICTTKIEPPTPSVETSLTKKVKILTHNMTYVQYYFSMNQMDLSFIKILVSLKLNLKFFVFRLFHKKVSKRFTI